MRWIERRRGFRWAVAAVLLVIGVQVAIAASADDLLQQAEQSVAEGKIKAAIIHLKNALQSDPGHVESRLMLGALYLRIADGPAAQKEFGRARDLGAARPDWLPGYARALMLQGQFQALLDEVEPDARLSPARQAELHAQRGNANLALRRLEQADAEYDAALALDSGQPVARLGKAQLLLNAGREDEALAQLNQVLIEHPSHAEVRLARGDLLRRLQRLDDAAVDYQRAVKEAPNNVRAHIGLALVHIAQRDVEAAKQDLARIQALAKDLPALNYLQALVSFQQQDFERASDELQALLRVAPGNLQAQLLYGIVSYARSEFTIADDYLTRVLSNTPGNTQVVKLLGAARLKLRQPERAVEVLAPVVDAQTEDVQLLALLGTAYIQVGDNTKGAEFIQRAVDLDPDQALLRTQLAVGRIVTGDTTAAISELESAVALGQDVLQADVLLVLSYLNKQQYDKAIAAAEALEQRMGDSPIPYNLTGLAYLARREFDTARDRFEQALEKDPGFLVARMNLARLALAADRPEEAAQAYQAVLRDDSRHLGAMLGMAALAQQRNDAEAIERWLLRAHDAHPNALQPILILAEGYLRRNEGLKASNLMSALPAEQAEVPAVLRLKGMAYLQSGDFGNAVFTLRRLTEAQPDSIEGWFQLARAQAAAGDAAASRDSFNRAIALDQEYQVPVVWVGLGELELRERRFREALEVGRQLKANFPDTVYGYDIEAGAYRGLDEPDKALAAAEAALRIQPTSARVNAFASGLVAAGRLDRGIAVLSDWVRENADDGLAWANLGMLRQQAGRDREALDAYENALAKVDPNPVILNNMAWLYLERDGRRAIELATRAYELAPTRAEIVDTYGWVLFRHGNQPEGLSALQQALVIAPRNPEIMLHVAEALHALDRSAEAVPMLERILREHPNSEYEKTARRLLERMRG